MLSTLGINIFYSLVTEIIILVVAWLLKDDKKRMIIVLGLGTIISGIIGFTPSGSSKETVSLTSIPTSVNIPTPTEILQPLTHGTIIWDRAKEGMMGMYGRYDYSLEYGIKTEGSNPPPDVTIEYGSYALISYTLRASKVWYFEQTPLEVIFDTNGGKDDCKITYVLFVYGKNNCPVTAGNSFVIQTYSGKLGKLRIINIDETTIYIEWVFQPNLRNDFKSP